MATKKKTAKAPAAEAPAPERSPSRFDYVRYDEKAVEKQAKLKAAFESIDHLVETTLDNGRAKALVYTKLEEAYMWAGKAIRDEQVADRAAELEEGRGDT